MTLDPERALQRAIIDHLRADDGVRAALGHPAAIYDEPPQDPGWPHLLIGRSESLPYAADGEATAPGLLRLTGLLRGQPGTERRAAQTTSAGAWVVAIKDLTAVPLAAHECGLPLVWRAGPAGAPPGGNIAADAELTWRALADRPWAPAHPKAEWQSGGDLALSWIRRARTGGDGWEIEPPVGEEREVYRVEVRLDGEVVETAEVETCAFTWTEEAQTALFPDGLPAGLSVRVSQGSATFGWGEAAQVAL